jgi:putative protease
MQKPIELLAPGGDINSIKAAILAGADAVYCGLDRFNARNRAVNIGFEDLQGILRLAHKNNCQVFLTLNIIILDSELPALFQLLNKLINTSIDGIIVQDLGLFYILSSYFKEFKIHASTQLTTHNAGQVQFLNKLSANRVNLSRELNLDEIKDLTAVCHQNTMLAEVFVHGSNCISFSGLCYMSSVYSGNSGNRGRCSQPCRDQYAATKMGKEFPLNLKDNSAYNDLRDLVEAGVDSIKIEGRIKKFHYVYTVVDAWRKQLDLFFKSNDINHDNSALYKVFNRDFSNDFLSGNISKDMFIDNPRDNSAIHLSGLHGPASEETLEKAKGDIYDERTDIIHAVENEINNLSVARAPLKLSFSGEEGRPLEISVETPDMVFSIVSDINLVSVTEHKLDHEMLLKRLKALNDSEYYIEHIDTERLQNNLFIPFNVLTTLKSSILFKLNGSRETISPIGIPVLTRSSSKINKPGLCILISSLEDIYLCNVTSANIYFQLPNCFPDDLNGFIKLFSNNERLIPWFPAILIGREYTAAVAFLKKLKPKCIVTNNIGIAYEAYRQEINWIAGPYLNIVNSFTLLCLKEIFKCSGAFISNEIKSTQIKSIKKPKDFELFYSIYHPIMLMTSRQCLFHQVTGCEKNKIDDTCIQQCEKFSSITNLKAITSFINKTKGNYHNLYHETKYLNTGIVADIPDLFNEFLIDLRDIETKTFVKVGKPNLIEYFEALLNGNSDAVKDLGNSIYPTTNSQYKKGI